jgi:acetyltransferase
MGGSSVANPRRHLKENGVTEFETPERGLKVLAKLKNYFEKKEEKEINVLSSSAKANKELKLISGNSGEKVSLKDSFEFIEKVGINTTKTIFVKSAEELEKAIDAQKIKLPVAIKIANGLAHKTDLGLVKTNLETKEEVINAFNEMQKKIKEFDLIKSSNNNANNNSSNASNNNSNNSKNVIAVQEMLDGKEVIVSAIRTEFGFVVTYGLGGIFVEIMKDYSQKIVPLSEKEIDEMLSETKGTKVLMGARTKKKYAIEELKKVIMLVTKIVYINPEIKEIEFNPLIINEKGCYAIDAVIVK